MYGTETINFCRCSFQLRCQAAGDENHSFLSDHAYICRYEGPDVWLQGGQTSCQIMHRSVEMGPLWLPGDTIHTWQNMHRKGHPARRWHSDESTCFRCYFCHQQTVRNKSTHVQSVSTISHSLLSYTLTLACAPSSPPYPHKQTQNRCTHNQCIHNQPQPVFPHSSIFWGR